MELDIPRNYFTLWMITLSQDLAGTRPVDHLKGIPTRLLRCAGSLPLALAPALDGYGPTVSAMDRL